MKDNQAPHPESATKWPPLAGDYIVSNPSAAIAVMTCGSYDLPKKLVEAKGKSIAIAGFCETENEGLAKIIQNVVSNPHIRYVIVCGERVRGHEPGQTLIALHSNGLNGKWTVIGSNGTIPTLLPTYFRGDDPAKYISRFMEQVVSVIDMTDETSIEIVGLKIDELSASRRIDPLQLAPIFPPQRKELNDWRKAIFDYVKKYGRDKVKARSTLGSMFTFTENDPLVYDMCGVKVGGHRGEHPTVMAGTIFYAKDKIVGDPKKGEFDRKAASDFIHGQDELSLHYSIPAMVHIVAQTREAIEKYILFVVDQTDSPLIIDSSATDTRIHGAKLAKDIGVGDRAIYNSVITPSDDERSALEGIGGTKYAIFLSYEESAEESVERVKRLVKHFGRVVEKPIVDPGVPRLGRGALSALERAWILKNQLSLPTTIGIHNLQSSQQDHRDVGFGFDYALPSIFGVDINLYGPIKNAARIFPSVAAAQIAIADESLKIIGVLPRQPHPYYQLFSENELAY